MTSQLISSHASLFCTAYPRNFHSCSQRNSDSRVANFNPLSHQTLILMLISCGPSNPGSTAHSSSRMTLQSTKDLTFSPLSHLITDLTTPTSSIPFSTSVNLDRDQCLSKDICEQFRLPNLHFDNIFDTAIAKHIVHVSADIQTFVNTCSTYLVFPVPSVNMVHKSQVTWLSCEIEGLCVTLQPSHP